ncbi:phage tail assembly chaperone [Pseudomonas sp. BNK-45]|uniref:phage tail assembly chaperone n=1 Tax=Pseudomonas sp. BNK-45 TaxID=3376180 RepID=UPI0039BF2CD5
MIYAKWIEADARFAFSMTDNDGQRITEEQHRSLLLKESQGMLIIPDSNGFPVVVDAPPPTVERQGENERLWRDSELSAVMWLRERHRDQLEIEAPTSIDGEQFKELLVYMQALRDWPQSADFPDTLRRPAVPLWIAEQIE